MQSAHDKSAWQRAAVAATLHELGANGVEQALRQVAHVLDHDACDRVRRSFADVRPCAATVGSVDELVPASQRRQRGAYFTPTDIAGQIAQWGVDTTCRRVADIACGDGALLLAAAQRAPAAELVGVELEIGFAFAAAARLRDHDARIICADGLADHDLGQFDAVLGNPPYVGEKGNREIFDRLRSEHPHLSGWFGPRMDLHYLFVHRGLDLLDTGGRLAYLTSEYWLSATGANRLREDLSRRAEHMRFERLGTGAFSSAPGHHSMMFACTRAEQLAIGSRASWHPFADGVRPACGTPLGELVRDRQGFVSGADRTTAAMTRTYGYERGRPIFLWTSDEIADSDRDLFRPLVRRSDCAAGRVFETPPAQHYVLWCDGTEDDSTASRIAMLLEPYRHKLESRREVRNGTIAWHRIWWPRRTHEYARPKLIVPRRATEPQFCLDLSGSFVSSDCTFLLAPDGVDDEVGWLTMIMNAANDPQVFASLRTFGKTKGDIVECYAEPLRKWRVPLRRDGQSLRPA